MIWMHERSGTICSTHVTFPTISSSSSPLRHHQRPPAVHWLSCLICLLAARKHRKKMSSFQEGEREEEEATGVCNCHLAPARVSDDGRGHLVSRRGREKKNTGFISCFRSHLDPPLSDTLVSNCKLYILSSFQTLSNTQSSGAPAPPSYSIPLHIFILLWRERPVLNNRTNNKKDRGIRKLRGWKKF